MMTRHDLLVANEEIATMLREDIDDMDTSRRQQLLLRTTEYLLRAVTCVYDHA